MSIRDEIRNRVSEERLFALPPMIQSDKVVRHVFVTKNIYDIFLTDPRLPNKEIIRFMRLRADLDHFSTGGEITMAMDPYKKPQSCFMALTDPVSDALWDIRSRDPKPGIRLLGKFSEKDTFIGLTWEYRLNLGGPQSKEWRDFIIRSKAIWNQLFSTYKSVNGGDPSDYVTENFIIV